MLSGVLRQGKRIRAVPPSSVEDDAWTVCAYGMGSIAPEPQKVIEEMKSLGLDRVRVEYKLAEAIKELEEHARVKIDVIVP